MGAASHSDGESGIHRGILMITVHYGHASEMRGWRLLIHLAPRMQSHVLDLASYMDGCSNTVLYRKEGFPETDLHNHRNRKTPVSTIAASLIRLVPFNTVSNHRRLTKTSFTTPLDAHEVC